MSSHTKTRQPRLRASCDGCFLAKVKCSKARPICSRCLACGIECRYSPSSRAGKPKSDSNTGHYSSSARDMSGMSPMSDDKNYAYTTHHHVGQGYYDLETGWDMSTTATDSYMAAAEMYPGTLPWTPPNDMTAAFTESPAFLSQTHSRSHSYDLGMSVSVSPWADAASTDMFGYSQTSLTTPTSMSPSYFPSPAATPNHRPTPKHKSASTGASGSSGSCTCFTACLQSLQALHNASSPSSPPFDLVLSLNRKAVEGCASMLSCPRCMSRSGTHTAAMLLGTIIGKITSFYKNASQSHFENGGMPSSASTASNVVGVSYGAYHVNGEDGRWLELEILARELRKLEEVYARFTEVCNDLSDDAEMSKAMIGYLGHTLGSTLEVVSHRKGGMAYS